MERLILPTEKSVTAEQAVLGSLLIDEDIAPALFAAVHVSDFITDTNQKIFLAARSLFRNNSGVDPITIANALDGVKLQTDNVRDYMAQLMQVTPTSANWKEYADIMRQESTLARAKSIAHDIANAATLNDVRPLVAGLSDILSARHGVRAWNATEMTVSFLDYQGECDENPAAGIEYVRYGIPTLDEGMYTEPGDVVIIGGYPSDGKTALALSFAWEMSAKRKVGFFSLETKREKIRDRLMSHVMQLNFTKIKRRQMTEPDWEHIAHCAVNIIPGHDFTVIEAGGMSAHDIQSISRAFGFQIIFVDYIQLVTPEAGRGATRAEQIASISRSMHQFAQSTTTTVFELAQLTRPEKSSGGTGTKQLRDPNMSDLKESGQLEQDADAILIVFRPELNKPARKLKVSKNKEGLTGLWHLNFDGSTQTFSLATNADIARDLSEKGRAAKNRNHMDAQDTYYQPSFDDSDMPF